RATSPAQRCINQTTLEWIAGNRTCPPLWTAARQGAHPHDCIHRERPAVDRGGGEISGTRSFPLTRRLLRDDSRRTIRPKSARSWLSGVHRSLGTLFLLRHAIAARALHGQSAAAPGTHRAHRRVWSISPPAREHLSRAPLGAGARLGYLRPLHRARVSHANRWRIDR